MLGDIYLNVALVPCWVESGMFLRFFVIPIFNIFRLYFKKSAVTQNSVITNLSIPRSEITSQ